MAAIARANTTPMNLAHHKPETLKTTTVKDTGAVPMSKDAILEKAQADGLKLNKGDLVNIKKNKETGEHTVYTKKTGEELRKDNGFFKGSLQQSANMTQALGRQMVANPMMAMGVMGGTLAAGAVGTEYLKDQAEKNGKQAGAQAVARQVAQGMPPMY